jgi:hypothetical protein
LQLLEEHCESEEQALPLAVAARAKKTFWPKKMTVKTAANKNKQNNIFLIPIPSAKRIVNFRPRFTPTTIFYYCPSNFVHYNI